MMTKYKKLDDFQRGVICGVLNHIAKKEKNILDTWGWLWKIIDSKGYRRELTLNKIISDVQVQMWNHKVYFDRRNVYNE